MFVKYSKGQLKIQQMSFVLVAIMIFFGLVVLVFLVFYMHNLKSTAQQLNDNQASELARQVANSPELAFYGQSCEDCVDLDKAMILKNDTSYKDFWGIKFLQIVSVYPVAGNGTVECTRGNYPDCDEITIIKNGEIGIPSEAYVSLCRWEDKQGGYFTCGIGKIEVTGETVNG